MAHLFADKAGARPIYRESSIHHLLFQKSKNFANLGDKMLPMDINGEWFNQLGSKMSLHVNGKNIFGTYHTKVGDASGQYELSGKVDTDNDESTAIGWVVLWNNESGSSDSVTAWSGQIQILSGLERIVTTWLLTTETDEDDTWHSTLIGKDVFTRLMPSPESQADSVQKGIKSSSPRT